MVDLGLWEKARRYRRIATFASDDDAARETKRMTKLGEGKIASDKRDIDPGKATAAE